MKPILLDLPMPIITPRLLIRPPQIGEGVILNEAILESFDVLHKFMLWAAAKPSIEDSEEFVRQSAANWILKKCQEPWLPLFIFNQKNQQFIGATGFHNMDWEIPCVETGYWIRNSCSGKGFMTEAVKAVTDYAFTTLGVKRIAITCDVNNVRSQKIPERLEYCLEATLKANRKDPVTGKISDTLVYAKYF